MKKGGPIYKNFGALGSWRSKTEAWRRDPQISLKERRPPEKEELVAKKKNMRPSLEPGLAQGPALVRGE